MLVSGFLMKGSLLIFVITIFRGLDVSCGCFYLSLQAGKSALPYLASDSLLLLVGVWLLSYKARRDQRQS